MRWPHTGTRGHKTADALPQADHVGGRAARISAGGLPHEDQMALLRQATPEEHKRYWRFTSFKTNSSGTGNIFGNDPAARRAPAAHRVLTVFMVS